ncbi:phage/plasmid replication domain-containing protein [Acidithiobacillus albertensis]|uniref:phage/plasmid replication domain-containing protein n=1 Tax=Acidithiobacillus albertensis TaxID=119978 RepID=UPI00094B624F|nr:phage/plasmid replication protein [Acidithiobacillus albertensis]
MIDTLRLTILADYFTSDALRWMQIQMNKLVQTDFTGDVQKWSLCTGLNMPSWADGFSLVVGSRVTLEASPKVYQGHNVDGPCTLREAASRLVDFVFGVVLRLDCWPAAGKWYVARLDITHSYDFGTRPALESWFDTVAGVQRGQRRASVDVRADDEQMAIHAAPSGRTLYQGLGSRYKVGKIYCKGADLKAHPPKCLSMDPQTLEALVEDFQPIARFECQARASWLSRQAVRLGLLPEFFAADQMGLLADNAALYLHRLGFTPLSSTRSKTPIVYFPVDYLADLLNIRSVWESEFSHLFAREVAMADDTLIKELLSLAKTPGAARAAFQFYNSVRQCGFSAARQSVGKTQFYAHRRLLGRAGVSDAMLQDGAALVRQAPSAFNVIEFKPPRERLDLVERAHTLALPSVIERLHQEVFRRAG